MVTNGVHHDSTFWGIRFPFGASPFNGAIIDIIEEYLEGSGHPVLETGLQRLYLTAILPSVISKADRKFIEHTIDFD
jgi:hypothetical protein